MKRLFAAIVVLLASGCLTPAFAVSKNAKNAFNNWHLCVNTDAGQLPPGYIGAGSRRFASTAVTWRVQPIGDMPSYVATAMGTVTSKLAGVATFTQVPYMSPAQITVRQGTSIHEPYFNVDLPVTNGCVTIPTLAAERETVVSTETVCANAAQVGTALATHELWWHVFTSFCHTASGCGDSNADSGAPAWECVAGQTELVRWFYTVPVGSVP